jgi:hypothetical protein
MMSRMYRGMLVLKFTFAMMTDRGDENERGIMTINVIFADSIMGQMIDIAGYVTWQRKTKPFLHRHRPKCQAHKDLFQGELVRTTGADVLAGPEFSDEFPDLGCIDRRDGEVPEGRLDRVFRKALPEWMKSAVRESLSDRVSHRKVSEMTGLKRNLNASNFASRCEGWDSNPRTPTRLGPQPSAFDLAWLPSPDE